MVLIEGLCGDGVGDGDGEEEKDRDLQVKRQAEGMPQCPGPCPSPLGQRESRRKFLPICLRFKMGSS